MLGPLADALLTVLLPPRCGSCRAPLAVRVPHGLCDACLEVVEPNLEVRCERCDVPSETPTCPRCEERPPAFDRVRAPYVYGGPLRDLVVAAKFRGREELADALAALLLEARGELEALLPVDVVTPVPLALGRRLKRGYNPSAVFARRLARALGVEAAHLLRRRRGTRAQSSLPLEARRHNVAEAFVARRPVSGTVLLVDDVVTTGETAHNAALALKRAGARAVHVVAIARSLEHDAPARLALDELRS